MRFLTLGFFAISSLVWGEEHLDLLIQPGAIEEKVQEVAIELNREYQGKKLTVLAVMKGGIFLASDLMRHLTMPFTLECIKASSYGQNGTTRGELTITGLDKIDLTGKDVLVIDDIFDSGHTMSGIVSKLAARNPNSVKTIVLVMKDVARSVNYRPDYTLFTIPNRFVVGYGLDYKEYFRGLPGVYAFKNDIPILP
ncbi:MAG TPA: hypoxanthine phosphoribosyltransferase [Chlamydiales bacterium]|nr:hypoxanthine phosphoribosyltransferase [Chlamydiales bacterium]